jgi:TonB family protein
MRIYFAGLLLCLTLPSAARAEPPFKFENFEMFVEPENLVVKDFANCRPTWPLSSKVNNESGTVEIKMLVGTDGVVRRTKLVNTSGFRDLDMATLKVYIGCQFKPVMVEGVSTETWISIKYTWSIE